MKAVFAVLSLLAVAVTADHLVFDKHLLKHGDVQGRVAVLHHLKYHKDEEDKPVGFAFGASTPVLRFLLLVPNLNKVAHLSKDGFASKLFGKGHEPKAHEFLKLTGNDLLVELVGLSDCKTWHAVLLKVWDHVAKVETLKALVGVKDADGKFKLDLKNVDELVDFVHVKVSVELLKGLFKKGLVAHLFTHKLHAKVKHLL